jgi:hypothetical protein
MLLQADNAAINAVVAIKARTGELPSPYLRAQTTLPLA